MNKYSKYISLLSAAAFCLLLPSCAADDFAGAEGEGQIKFKMVVNSEVTRAESDEASLADKCRILISGSKGLLYKFDGISNVPSDLYLKCGNYVAEAWTGDSVSASFDKKFYRTYQPITVQKGVNNVVLNCKIANVVASINPEPIIQEALKDYTVTVSHSRASLDFTADNAATAHGYFMMPSADKDLNWTITGTREDGTAFTKSGVIANVQRAHEYVLNIKYTPQTSELGGGIITVEIDDTELVVESEIELQAPPKISGMGFEIGNPITASAGTFERKSVFLQCVGRFESIALDIQPFSPFGLPRQDYDFMQMSDEARQQLLALGLQCTDTYDADKDVSTARISFSPEMLNRLTDGSYTVAITASNSYKKSRTARLELNVSDAPVAVFDADADQVFSYSATISGNVAKAGQQAPGLRFRKAGDSAWQTAAAPSTDAGPFRLTITNLSPATRYEYQAVGDGYNGESHYFTTESVFEIPNAGFETWSTNSKGANIPGPGGTPSFWDTGNHGSIVLKVNITSGVSSPVHSGALSACLESKYVSMFGIGKLAAGNIFTGTYDKTTGTNGEITFGRPFDGSRPVSLSGYASYIPGTVDCTSPDVPELPDGSTDKGQIYVALVSSPVKVKTADKSTLFNPSADYVIAYGQITFDSTFGSASELKKFNIELNYLKPGVKAGYLVIVASASKYGDYFAGSSSSVMYLDDLMLEYK